MERGYLAPNGDTYIASRSGGMGKIKNQRIKLKKLSYIFNGKHHEMSEIKFSEKGARASIKEPWRGLFKLTEFDRTYGRLFETKELIIFIGIIRYYGIYGRSGKWESYMRRKRANTLKKKKYNSYFIIAKSTIKGFVKRKRKITIYAISSKKKVVIRLESRSNIDKDKFPFLPKFLEIENVKELDRRHRAEATEESKMETRLQMSILFGVLFTFFGIIFLLRPEKTTLFIIGLILVSLAVIMGIISTHSFIQLRSK